MQLREKGGTQDQEGEGGEPPGKRVLPAHALQETEEGLPPTKTGKGGTPEHRVIIVHGMQEREGWGTPTKRGRGGQPLSRSEQPSCVA